MVARVRSSSQARTRLTARGWVFLLASLMLVVLAYALRRPELLFLGCFAAAIPSISLMLIRLQRPQLQARRTLVPLVVTAGRPTTVRLEVQNLARRPVASATWADAIGWLPAGGAAGRLPALQGSRPGRREPRSQARLVYRFVPPRRGLFEVGPFTVTRTDPFGLARSTQLCHRAESVTVVPKTVVLPESGLTIAEADGSARLVQHRTVGSDHDVTTRSYRTGDALRRVHWRASAHHGELMVRQEEQRSHSEASVLLDTRRSGFGDASALHGIGMPESDRFEWAIEFAGSLVIHLQRSGFVVHLHETSSTQLAHVENTTRFLESLSTVQLSSVPVRLDEALGAAAQSGSAPGSMFAVLSDADADVVDGLAARRGLFELAVAFLVCPDETDAIGRLSEAGWTCVLVRPGDSPEGAWLAVADAAGRGGGRVAS